MMTAKPFAFTDLCTICQSLDILIIQNKDKLIEYINTWLVTVIHICYFRHVRFLRMFLDFSLKGKISF